MKLGNRCSRSEETILFSLITPSDMYRKQRETQKITYRYREKRAVKTKLAAIICR